MQKKQLTLVVVSLLVVVLSVSLAYFTTQIIGKGKNLDVSSTNLQIVFTDSDGAISGADIEPGWSDTKTFTVQNNSKSAYKYNIVIKDLVNTFVTEGYLQYKITSTNNGYNMTDYVDVPKSATATDTILAKNVSVAVGVTQTYTIEFRYVNDENVDQSVDMNKVLKGTLFITEGTEETVTLYSKMLVDNPTISERNDFSTSFTETTTGTIYKSTESIAGNTSKEVYYYAGNTTNNWVKFGGYYWRIIRTNYDGSIRLLYAGTSHDTTSGYIGVTSFNSINDNPMYVGYMYGTEGSLENNRANTNNSTIKTAIDNWYKQNMTSYTKYLSTTAVYCNDRELGDGYSYSITEDFSYVVDERLNNGVPTYNCNNVKDAFSVDNLSAKLTYPVALITADEITFAGGLVSSNLSSPYAWYITNSNGESIIESNYFWTNSPSIWQGYSIIFNVNGGENVLLDTMMLDDEYGTVRPVISLKSDVLWSSGDGTADSPYEIVLN